MNEKSVPEVTVLTPAYNAEKYIAQAIESILEQTFKDFEFIIIDDCSNDNTWEIIQGYAAKDERIIAMRNEKNLGIAGNRNRGVSLSRGNYIVWQDADDISFPRRLEHQYKFLEENKDVGIVGGYLQFFDDNGSLSIRKYAAYDEALRKKIFRYSPVAQPAAMIRKRSLDEAGKYDLRYPPAEDLDMSFRIGRRYKFANLQEVIVRYRQNNSSATFTQLKTIELNTLSIRKKYSVGAGYVMSAADKLYNLLQFSSVFLIPPRLKISLFNLLRNSK